MINDKYKIPKLIHYIWLGPKPLDSLSKKCIKTWEKILPDYKIMCWNDENSLDIIKNNKYAYQAYKAKKYAFVSDYLRLYALYHYGGIYMDTDVKVVKNIDSFLKYSAFTSFENDSMIPTALMGSEKHGEWIKYLLEYYDTNEFILDNGNYNFTTNVVVITEMSKKLGLIQNGKRQVLDYDVHIFPREYFCPLDTLNSRNNNITHNTYAMHLFNGSWTPGYRRILSKIKKKFGINPQKILGKRLYEKISRKY